MRMTGFTQWCVLNRLQRTDIGIPSTILGPLLLAAMRGILSTGVVSFDPIMIIKCSKLN